MTLHFPQPWCQCVYACVRIKRVPLLPNWPDEMKARKWETRPILTPKIRLCIVCARNQLCIQTEFFTQPRWLHTNLMNDVEHSHAFGNVSTKGLRKKVLHQQWNANRVVNHHQANLFYLQTNLKPQLYHKQPSLHTGIHALTTKKHRQSRVLGQI